ncbi:uncharacterized protein FOMMEDRAFT_97733 [Fomitiporia mediterranea MF3/22]|uniref:uncharacterized protein n=1 Tax=Fomitiporia mediterranea (strain MF3/22) TaxID=694068 RepID=UPI0004408F4F|nr:uncharacterized protein FOMMEDRAFT_97733 [Fomitiporia mediterranea MF3/22]EJC97923.1 hypothetical protein FOMMEDRAFT_97733 [Fomitiporia mediterranea MF3/22]
MRIIALPLTSEAASTGLHTYYHFQTPPPAKQRSNPTLFKKVTEKAASLWASFGKAPEKSWKRRIFTTGERMMDRIEFEELSLKSMDPSLGPKLSKFGRSDMRRDEKDTLSIPLVYPPFYEQQGPPLKHLRTLLGRRTPKHQKGFYIWLLISPLTAPFMLVPIIPNLPFFFCVWRSWHHYRAFKASSYLEALMDKGAIRAEPNIALDKVYETYKPDPPPTTKSLSPESSTDSTTTARENEDENAERIVLGKEAVPKIVSLFDLPPSAAADLYRALEQTESRLEKARS